MTWLIAKIISRRGGGDHDELSGDRSRTASFFFQLGSFRIDLSLSLSLSASMHLLHPPDRNVSHDRFTATNRLVSRKGVEENSICVLVRALVPAADAFS